MNETIFALHITEGIFPPKWAALWFIIALPFVTWGLHDLKVKSLRMPAFKLLVGLVGAAIFVISCMPIPIPGTGTCSHPAGAGIGAILIGAPVTVVVSSIALLLQALFLAHGGLSTLGGNLVAMGIAGAFSGGAVFWSARKIGFPAWFSAFLCGAISHWAAYATTAFMLASALPSDVSLLKMFAGIGVALMPTQIPLGILEGVLTAAVYQFIRTRRPELIT